MRERARTRKRPRARRTTDAPPPPSPAEPVDGTSCAAPTFSGIISLLNDARAAAGKRPLGYLNTIFYKHPEVFTDVTAGSNPGCGTKGFPAAVGWDPVTGLGAPNFPAMMTLALSLP